jgi:hypothetical protein
MPELGDGASKAQHWLRRQPPGFMKIRESTAPGKNRTACVLIPRRVQLEGWATKCK